VQGLDRHGRVIVTAVARLFNPTTTLDAVIRRGFRLGLRLGMLAGLGYAVLKMLRRREPDAAPSGAPTWPPVTPATKRPAPQPEVRPDPRPEPSAAPEVPTAAPVPPPAAPPAHAWVEPSSDDLCPQSHAIKAKLSSKIFHLPGMLAYERTKPDRCYAEESAAEADGLRKAKR
jgi:hypothetical protein